MCNQIYSRPNTPVSVSPTTQFLHEELVSLTFSLFGAIASSSSMKIMAGAFFSASSNAFLKLLSDSPASLLIISGPNVQLQNMQIKIMEFKIKHYTSQLLADATFTDFPLTIYKEEKSSSLICNSPGNKSLPSSRRSVQQDTTRGLVKDHGYEGSAHKCPFHLCKMMPLVFNRRRVTHLHTDGLKESRVTQGQFHHLLNLSQLLPHAPNVIIANFIQGLFLILDPQKCSSFSVPTHHTHFQFYEAEFVRKRTDKCSGLHGQPTSRLMGSPSQWMTVSGATIQYGLGSVSTTLNSTARMPPLTRKISPVNGDSYLLQKAQKVTEQDNSFRPHPAEQSKQGFSPCHEKDVVSHLVSERSPAPPTLRYK